MFYIWIQMHLEQADILGLDQTSETTKPTPSDRPTPTKAHFLIVPLPMELWGPFLFQLPQDASLMFLLYNIHDAGQCLDSMHEIVNYMYAFLINI